MSMRISLHPSDSKVKPYRLRWKFNGKERQKSFAEYEDAEAYYHEHIKGLYALADRKQMFSNTGLVGFRLQVRIKNKGKNHQAYVLICKVDVKANDRRYSNEIHYRGNFTELWLQMRKLFLEIYNVQPSDLPSMQDDFKAAKMAYIKRLGELEVELEQKRKTLPPPANLKRRGRVLSIDEQKQISVDHHFGGVSQRALAEKWGVSRRRISEICKEN